MSKTMLLAVFSLALACAQPADQEDSQPQLEDQHPLASQDGDPGGCAEQGDFDVEVFADEILPILAGEIDLNHPGEESLVGCNRAPCHGTPRPGGFFLDVGDTPENNLERFACFVDRERPKRSQILLCPKNDEGCAAHPHPGAVLFTGPADLNYRRILRYIKESSL